jgi:predicted dehydrogenase
MTKSLKAVLAGCGGISNAWLSACKDIPGLEIAGLVDLNESAALKRRQEYHLDGAVTGTNLDEILDAVRPDLLFDCTVPEAHLPTTLT